MDARCPACSIFNNCRTYSEFTAAAAALIPSDGGSSEPFWALAARTLFIEMCMKLIEKKMTTNQALADNLMTADLKQVHKLLTDASQILPKGRICCAVYRIWQISSAILITSVTTVGSLARRIFVKALQKRGSRWRRR